MISCPSCSNACSSLAIFPWWRLVAEATWNSSTKLHYAGSRIKAQYEQQMLQVSIWCKNKFIKLKCLCILGVWKSDWRLRRATSATHTHLTLNHTWGAVRAPRSSKMQNLHYKPQNLRGKSKDNAWEKSKSSRTSPRCQLIKHAPRKENDINTAAITLEVRRDNIMINSACDTPSKRHRQAPRIGQTLHHTLVQPHKQHRLLHLTIRKQLISKILLFAVKS